jgi:hypothetical protein
VTVDIDEDPFLPARVFLDVVLNTESPVSTPHRVKVLGRFSSPEARPELSLPVERGEPFDGFGRVREGLGWWWGANDHVVATSRQSQ